MILQKHEIKHKTNSVYKKGSQFRYDLLINILCFHLYIKPSLFSYFYNLLKKLLISVVDTF